MLSQVWFYCRKSKLLSTIYYHFFFHCSLLPLLLCLLDGCLPLFTRRINFFYDFLLLLVSRECRVANYGLKIHSIKMRKENATFLHSSDRFKLKMNRHKYFIIGFVWLMLKKNQLRYNNTRNNEDYAVIISLVCCCMGFWFFCFTCKFWSVKKIMNALAIIVYNLT